MRSSVLTAELCIIFIVNVAQIPQQFQKIESHLTEKHWDLRFHLYAFIAVCKLAMLRIFWPLLSRQILPYS